LTDGETRKKNKKVQISRPAMFSEHNSGMGGTDLMDENINRFRVGIRGKKKVVADRHLFTGRVRQ